MINCRLNNQRTSCRLVIVSACVVFLFECKKRKRLFWVIEACQKGLKLQRVAELNYSWPLLKATRKSFLSLISTGFPWIVFRINSKMLWALCFYTKRQDLKFSFISDLSTSFVTKVNRRLDSDDERHRATPTQLLSPCPMSTPFLVTSSTLCVCVRQFPVSLFLWLNVRMDVNFSADERWRSSQLLGDEREVDH